MSCPVSPIIVSDGTDGTRRNFKIMDYSIIEEFNRFWILFGVDETKFPRRRACTLKLWMDMPQERRDAIIEHLRQYGAQSDKNPYFFIQDFQNKPRQELSFKDYYARFHTTEERDGWVRKFLPEQQKTIYVKQN